MGCSVILVVIFQLQLYFWVSVSVIFISVSITVTVITACTVVQAVVKANSQSNGNGQISTPRGSKTPERISMKLAIYNYIGSMTKHASLHGAATTWMVLANTWLVTCFGFLVYLFLLYSWDCAQPALLDRSIRHMTCFRARKCLLGVSMR